MEKLKFRKKILNVETVKKILQPYLKQKAEVLKAILFGSLAKGEASRRSDIDLILIVNSDKPFLKRYDDFEELFALFPYTDVEIFLWTPEELEQIKNRPFVKRILQEGVVIYEQEQTVS